MAERILYLSRADVAGLDLAMSEIILALGDIATASLVYELALEKSVGTWLPL